MFNSPTVGFPCNDLRKILPGCQQMASVPNGAEILLKVSIAWVGRTNVTDRQTTADRQTDGRSHVANVNVKFTFTKNWQIIASLKFDQGNVMPPTTDLLFCFLIFRMSDNYVILCCALFSHQRCPLDVRKLLAWLGFNFRGCQIIYTWINSVAAFRLQ